MEPKELTPDELHKVIMEVWARRTERELGDNIQRVPQRDLSGNQSSEQGAK